MLQLLDVAEVFHAGADAVDVAAQHIPTRAVSGEAVEAVLLQQLVAVCTLLHVDVHKRLVLWVERACQVALFHAARLDQVDDLDALVVVLLVPQPLDGLGDVRPVLGAVALDDELLDHLRHAHRELAAQRVDVAVFVLSDDVLACSERAERDDVGRVPAAIERAGAERAELGVDGRCAVVEVRAGQDGADDALRLTEPVLDACRIHHFGVGRLQAEPRACRAGHARHHASSQRTQGLAAGVVDDLGVALAALAILALEQVAAPARDQVIRDLDPVRAPARAIILEALPAQKDRAPLALERAVHQVFWRLRYHVRPLLCRQRRLLGRWRGVLRLRPFCDRCVCSLLRHH